MSATTVTLESFDANMLDYPADGDIPMYPGSATLVSETWTLEAVMADDQDHNSLAHSNSISEPIEIDMDSNEVLEEYTEEYEMTDDAGDATHPEGVGYEQQELLDIEVLDAPASRLISPALNPISTSDEAPALDASASVGLESYDSILSSPSTNQAQVSEPVAAENIPLGAAEPETSFEVAPEYSAVEERQPSLPAEAQLEQSAQQVASTESHDGAANVPEDEIDIGLAHAEVPSSQQVVEHHLLHENEGDVAAPESTPYVEPGSTAVETSNSVDVTANPTWSEEVAPPNDGDNVAADTVDHPQEVQEQDVPEIEHPDHASQFTGSGDPHEISEGVYIDPPPAVLFTISTQSGEIEGTLFNQPTRSRSHSPHGATSATNHPALTLLLHEQPTLYYEPLSVVFAALRQEEAIRNTPELVEGELVLDAYDLQLVMPEVSPSS
ncbi:hypothetical protein K474DRAFT_211840 [Panus rudis PR-1116 ss-1]|nr:hypothetical protein K474DRAFT_211840 [Panus rudis PR-1116 ss-1]